MTTLQDASVLVTGGAGFIGSHVVDRLLENETVARVRVIDNLVNGRSENLAAAARDPRFEFVKADIRDEDQLDAALDGVSVVMHLACLGVRHSLHAPLENHEVNATATLNLLEIARRRAWTSSSMSALVRFTAPPGTRPWTKGTPHFRRRSTADRSLPVRRTRAPPTELIACR